MSTDYLIIMIGIVILAIAIIARIFIVNFKKGYYGEQVDSKKKSKRVKPDLPSRNNLTDVNISAKRVSEQAKQKTIQDVQRKASSQGAGLADQREQVININNIFISYRRSDSADVTGRIYDRLIQQFGRDKVFKDVDSIPLGVDFRKHLNQIVSGCKILLAVMGNQWLETKDSQSKRRLDNSRDHVRIEIESALQSGVPVIPILVRGASMPSEDDLPSSLKDLAYRNGISVRVDPDFHKDVDRLIAGIETHLKGQINKK